MRIPFYSFCFFLFITFDLKAQNTFPATGNVGIGTNSPISPLQVIGEARFQDAPWFSPSNNGVSTVAMKIGQNQTPYGTQSVISLSTEDALGLNTVNWISSRWAHAVKFKRNSSSGIKDMVQIGGQEGTNGLGESYVNIYSVNGVTPRIRLTSDATSYVLGSLGIGTTDVKGYMLAVAGDMIAAKIKVKLPSTWPDYVFDTSYYLQPLSEVEAFIRKNKHLPGVLPASVIEQEGIDVGDTQSALLKKIEELTLHLIELNKKVEKLEAENKRITQENQQIRTLLPIASNIPEK